MAKLNAIDKAVKLVSEEGIFKITDTPNYEYWIVKGHKKDNYEIIYNKHTDIYNCGCKNIRFLECSHIIAIKIVKGDIEDEEMQGDYLEPIIQG